MCERREFRLTKAEAPSHMVKPSAPTLPYTLVRPWAYMAGTESALNETSLRRRLKRDTAAGHQHLETQLGLLNPSLDVHRYRRVLETFYGFYVPVEINVTQLAAAAPALGFPLRARAAPCRGPSPGARPVSGRARQALPLCRDRPELSCFEDLAGCLLRARRRVSRRTGPHPAVAPATRPRERRRCCLLRRRRGVDAAEVDRRPLPGSTDCRARGHQPQGSSVPRRRRSMRSRDGRWLLTGDPRGRSEQL